MTISTDLGTQLEAFVHGLIESGRYQSEAEVLREGVRLIQERETRLSALDAMIAQGLDAAETGQVKSARAVFDRLEVKYQTWG